jgi:hypothetical protein
MMFKLRAGLGAEAVISTSMTAIVMVAASTIKRETASRIKHTSKLLLNGVCRFPDVSGMLVELIRARLRSGLFRIASLFTI